AQRPPCTPLFPAKYPGLALPAPLPRAAAVLRAALCLSRWLDGGGRRDGVSGERSPGMSRATAEVLAGGGGAGRRGDPVSTAGDAARVRCGTIGIGGAGRAAAAPRWLLSRAGRGGAATPRGRRAAGMAGPAGGRALQP